MANYQIDPLLKQAIEQGSINRILFDIEHRRITIWHNSVNLRDEVDRIMAKAHDFENKERPVLKSDYAFNAVFSVFMAGVWPCRNLDSGSELKSEFVFDLYKDLKVENRES